MPPRKKTTKKKSSKENPSLFAAYCVFFSGLFLCAFSVFLLLSFITADITLDSESAAKVCVTGLVGAWLSYGALITSGIPAAYLLSVLIFCWGAHIMKTGRVFATWPAVLGGIIMAFSVSILCGVIASESMFFAGGLVSAKIYPPAKMYFGGAGVTIAALVLLCIGLVMSFGLRVFVVAEWTYFKAKATVIAFASLFYALSGEVITRARPKLTAALVSASEGAMVPIKEISKARVANKDRALRAESKSKNKRITTIDKIEEPIVIEDSEEDLEEINEVIVNAEVQEVIEPEIEIISEEEPISELDLFNIESTSLNEVTATFADEMESEILENPYEKLANEKPKVMPVIEDKVADKLPTTNDEPYVLPPMGMLDEKPPSKGSNPAQLEKRAKMLEATLADFKIQGQVVHIERGPRITQFEISLAPGIKLSRVSGLADNISMTLKAPSIRIIAPIPGKDTIGIEIPNIEQELVCLKEIVEAVNREKRKQALPLCLAKDVSGKPIIGDLAKMPHLLIAGATGSGKSVCINSIIMSFLMCCKYDECKLIMVDPKVVELSRFKNIPHLMSPVITDMTRAVGVLEWACQEMDKRYEKLSMVSVNNLAKFNSLSVEEREKRVKSVYGEEELDTFPKKLPYIVIIIDELADLMMVAKKEVENHIARLAAKSRAVGIHLILATQRPSTDVITGLIKANMPSRIAFQVASKIDSRIILDQMGADALLGQGDMLYLPPGVSKVQRSQGVFVSDEELFKVVDFCKAQRNPEYHHDLEGPVIGTGAGDFDITQYDELFLEAAQNIIESGRGSVSLLQRKLGIGYGRASRIIDQLAEAGVLGPFKEGKAREILMDIDQYESTFLGGVFDKSNSSTNEGELAGLRADEKAPAMVPWD